jgi:hypothetical protein
MAPYEGLGPPFFRSAPFSSGRDDPHSSATLRSVRASSYALTRVSSTLGRIAVLMTTGRPGHSNSPNCFFHFHGLVGRHQCTKVPMPKLTNTQTIIFSAVAWRADTLAMPLPKGLHGAVSHKAVGTMSGRGWLKEVYADPHKGEPLWRETGDGHSTALIATNAVEPSRPEPTNTRKQFNVLLAFDDLRVVFNRACTKLSQLCCLGSRRRGAEVFGRFGARAGHHRASLFSKPHGHATARPLRDCWSL